MIRLLIIAMLVLMTQAHAAEFRWPNSWDRNFPSMVAMVETYIKEVEVASGSCHFLYPRGAYHFGISPTAIRPEPR